MFVVEVEFFCVHRLLRYKNSVRAYCFVDGCEHYSVFVPRRLRQIVERCLYNGCCYIGVDSLSNIRCVFDDSRCIVFLDSGCKIAYKINSITPLTSRIIF